MSDDTRLEPDRPHSARLLVMVVVTVAVLVVVVTLIVQFWNFTIQAEVDKKQQRPESTQLAALRAQEKGRLESYEWANQQEGVVRIPVAEAMRLTLRDWKDRPAGLMDSADKMALDAQKSGTAPAPAPGAGTTPPAPQGGTPPPQNPPAPNAPSPTPPAAPPGGAAPAPAEKKPAAPAPVPAEKKPAAPAAPASPTP
jgi:hypothetical protein